MLEHNRNVKKKLNKLSRAALLILPALCVVMLLSQTALPRVLISSTTAARS